MSDRGTAYLCAGCRTLHGSGLWYYREEHGERTWLCGIQYLLLRPHEMDQWRLWLTV